MAAQTTKLSSKGQVVIPKSLRTAHRWKPGTEFIVEEQGDSILLRPKQKRENLQWEKLIGCLNYKGPRKTIREMDEAVMAEAVGHK
jgi:AbrB family looped-hinge helix DNA binding protein